MGFGKIKFEKERKAWETEIKKQKISLVGLKKILAKRERENGKVECRLYLN